MAKMKKYFFEKEFVQVPNETANAVKEDISLQALGLIVNLWSYSDEWELHKTELYKRFIKNKETSVKTAWNELVDSNYIIEYKYRVGKKFDYDYFYNIKPFTQEQKEIILKEAIELYGEISRLDFQDLKMKSPKSRGNKDIKKEKRIKENITTTTKLTLDDSKLFAIKYLKKITKHQEAYEKMEGKINKHCKEGTKEELINYVDRIVEEHDKPKRTYNNNGSKRGKGAIRTEIVPDWIEEAEKEVEEKSKVVATDEDILKEMEKFNEWKANKKRA